MRRVSRWPNDRSRQPQGFTVIELCIAVMIVSLLGAFAAPQLTALLQRYRLHGAARVVWGDLHKARALAIKENRTVRLDFSGTAYSVVRADTAAVVTTRDLTTQYPGITLTAPASLAFTSAGLLAGTTQTIQVQNTIGTKHVTVLATGRIGSS